MQRRWLTFERTTIVVTLVLAFAVAVRPAVDNDLWWHLGSGQWMVDHGTILRADPFSHTRLGAVRQPSDWLGQLGLYGTWAGGGLTAVTLLTAALATAGCALIVRACRGPVLLRAALVTLAAASSSVFWSARPQMVTFVLTAAVVLAVERLRQGPRPESQRWLWALVPLFAFWSNVHLGWFYGLFVLWAVVLGELFERLRNRRALDVSSWRTLSLVSAASLLAVMVNPVGPPIYRLVLTQVDVGRRFIQENQPPSPADPAALPFVLMLVGTVAVLAWRWRRLSVTDVLLVGGTAVAALVAVRTVSLFATVAAPVLSRYLSGRDDMAAEAAGEREPADVSTALNVGLVLVVVGLAVLMARARLAPASVHTELRQEFPVEAVAWIEENRPPREMFNTFDWGGYLIWQLPGYPVSIDGRADLYADELQVYARILAGQGWENEFQRRRIGFALVPTGGPLARAVTAHPAWRIAHADRQATVLVRATG